MKSLILIGNGGHCRSCIEVINTSRKFKIKGIIVHPKDQINSFMNYKVLGNDQNLNSCFDSKDLALICVGHIPKPDIRIRLYNLLKDNNISLATVRSKYSIISKNVLIDNGTVVMHNVIINSGVKVGKNCILNTKSLIEHDVKIGDHCHISTGAIINGGAEIGYGCFLGSGVIIREGIKIGDNTIISAGQIVMGDVPSGSVIKTN